MDGFMNKYGMDTWLNGIKWYLLMSSKDEITLFRYVQGVSAGRNRSSGPQSQTFPGCEGSHCNTVLVQSGRHEPHSSARAQFLDV